jgi:hypothetical protein
MEGLIMELYRKAVGMNSIARSLCVCSAVTLLSVVCRRWQGSGAASRRSERGEHRGAAGGSGAQDRFEYRQLLITGKLDTGDRWT